MALTYGFYDSVASDRVYNAKQMSSIFDGVIRDGVYATIGEALLVTAGTGMQVLVGTGRAWFDHTWTLNDSSLALSINTAHALLPRIDVVYLEVNQELGVRANSIAVLAGTPSATPVAPTLTNTTTIHQYPLAHVRVDAAVTQIANGKITNKVGYSETPFVTGILSVLALDDIIAQWEAQWEQWFADIQGQLTTEAETHLQAQIWDLAGVLSGEPPYAANMVDLSTHDHSSIFPQIGTTGIATGAVTESKLGNLAVTNGKIGNAAVNAIKLATDAVETAKIKNANVTLQKMANSSVGTNQLVNQSVTNEKLAANSVDSTQIVNNAVTAAKIPDKTRRVFIPVGACWVENADYWPAMYSHVRPVQLVNTDEDGMITGAMMQPGDMKSGDTPDFYVLWHADPYASSGNCRFVLEWSDNGDDESMMLHSTAYVTATGNTPYASGMLTYTKMHDSISFNNMLSFKFWRKSNDALDTLLGNAYIYGFLVVYTADY